MRPHRLIFLLTAAALLLLVGADKARAKTSLKAELQVGALFDNNAALGRRGIFGSEAVVDITSVVGGRVDLDSDLGKRVKFFLSGKLRSEEGRWRQYLRSTEAELKPGLEFRLGKDIALRPEVGFKLHREVEHQWGYLEAKPSLNFIAHTRFGMMFDIGYDFTATLYDSEEATNTYANIDRLSHLARIKMKIWQTQWLRYQIKAEVEHQTFGDNIEERLAHIVFAPVEEFTNPDVEAVPYARKDLFVRGDLELLFIPWKHLAVAVSYKVEADESNLDAFTAFSHGPRLALAFQYGRHEAYLEARVSLYDFRKFRFDVRFADTREDIKTEGFAAYSITFAKAWKVTLKATFLRNDSNDWHEFDPALTRSYSIYQGMRVEAMLSYTWDTSSGKKEKKPEPKLPGTIMANR